MKQVILQGDNEAIIGNEMTIFVSGITEASKFTWEFDNIVLLEKNKDFSKLTIEPLLSGEYNIRYTAVHKDATYKGTKKIRVYASRDDKPQENKDNLAEADHNLDPYQEVILSERCNTYHLPHFIKRNARYRGQRESEKVLNGNYEQLFDIRQNHTAIKKQTSLVTNSIEMWFSGRKKENINKRTIKEEKVYQAEAGKLRYRLNDLALIGSFSNVVIKLDDVVVNKDLYEIKGHQLLFDISKVSPETSIGTLHISYEAVIQTINDDTKGVNPISNHTARLSERLAEAERRYMNHENAYQ